MYDVLRFSIRPYLRACVLVGAGLLASFQVNAQAVQDWDFQRFYTKTVDGVGTVGFGAGAGSAVPATYNPPTAGAGGSLNLSGTAKVPTAGGRAATVTLTGNLSKANAAKAFKALAIVAGGPLGVAFFAIPAIIDWMSAAGVSRAPDGSFSSATYGPVGCTGQSCPTYTLGNQLVQSANRYRIETLQSAGCPDFVQQSCSLTGAYCAAQGWALQPHTGFGPQGQYCRFRQYSSPTDHWNGTPSTPVTSPPGTATVAPISIPELDAYMDEPTLAPAYADALKAAGATVGLTAPQLTGQPSTSSTTKQTTKVNPDGSTTTTNCSTSDALLYNSANMTFSTVETCTTTNPTGTTAGQTQTATSVTTSVDPSTTSTPEEQKSDLCKDNPDIVACQTLGSDDTQIPKTDKDVTYSQESRFGGGSCPTDKYQTINGVNLKLWDWAQACAHIVNWVRPLLLLLAAWTSLMIVSGVRTENPV